MKFHLDLQKLEQHCKAGVNDVHETLVLKAGRKRRAYTLDVSCAEPENMMGDWSQEEKADLWPTNTCLYIHTSNKIEYIGFVEVPTNEYITTWKVVEKLAEIYAQINDE